MADAEKYDPGLKPRWMILHRGNLRTWLLVAGCFLANPRWEWMAAAWGVSLLGIALHIWSKGCLRINEDLTTSGPYRWVRHPFYLANALTDLGVCFAIHNWWLTGAYAVLWILIYFRQIFIEESNMVLAAGEKYRLYLREVPRLLPWKGPRRGLPPSEGFSWSNPNLAAGKEYGRALQFLYTPLIPLAGNLAYRWGRFHEFLPGMGMVTLVAATAAVCAGKLIQLALYRALKRPPDAS